MKLINEVIGKYRISKLIGSGGMSSVYEAEHEILGNKVAIKILNSIFSLNEVVRERFKNEAKIMASLNHPNIARIIDFDEQPQQLSIIMELYEGEDLNSRIHRSGPLSISELKDVFGQVLSALQYAHDKGVIHRDIKPSNIYLLPNGQIKVLDFGIAKVYGQGHEMTQTGQQIGTPVYMSPEQVRSEKTIDHRTDIYSLGVTIFFSLNGKPPYDSTNESHFSILTKIVNEPIPVLKVNDEFNTIISKACAKDPNQRFNNCRDFNELLNNEHQSPISNNIQIFENENLTIHSPHYDVTITSNIDINNPLNDDIEFWPITIGNQVWMSKNLNVDRFRNGDLLEEVKTDEEWINATKLKIPAWCFYGYDTRNEIIYGRLYNWYAVNDPRGLSPEGWVIPNKKEWIELIDFLGGNKIGGKKLKSKNQWEKFAWSETEGNNINGFNGFPGGFKKQYSSFANNFGKEGYWWSSSLIDDEYASAYFLSYSNTYIHQSPMLCGAGLSVRCIKK